MKNLIAVVILAFLPACDFLRDEAGYPGGRVERIADEKIFEARSQRQRADRYLMSLTILAPLAADFTETSSQAKSAAVLINSGYDVLARMRAASNPDTSCLNASRFSAPEKAQGSTVPAVTSVNCGLKNADATDDFNSAFAFEAHSREMQSTLYSLSKLVLNAAELDGLAEDIVELNYLGVIRHGKRVFPVARRALATYRDTIVVYADAVNAACGFEQPECAGLKDELEEFRTGKNVKISDEFAERAIRALLRSVNASMSVEDAQTWQLKDQHIKGLVYHIDVSCQRLVGKQFSDNGQDELDKVENCGGTHALLTADGNKTSANRKTFLDQN
ncbi:MAG: hypothetical protein ABJF86_03485 [Tateyamaria sp.]|uniref:hypothetical protein n=1 Tax=Tateyamaria sp. TaxID=1929288 RepID=UPI0032805700